MTATSDIKVLWTRATPAVMFEGPDFIKRSLKMGVGFLVASIIFLCIAIVFRWPPDIFGVIALLGGLPAALGLGQGIYEMRKTAKYRQAYSEEELKGMKAILTLTEFEIVDIYPGRRFKLEKWRTKYPFLRLENDTTTCPLSSIKNLEILARWGEYQLRINKKYTLHLKAEEITSLVRHLYTLNLPVSFPWYFPREITWTAISGGLVATILLILINIGS